MMKPQTLPRTLSLFVIPALVDSLTFAGQPLNLSDAYHVENATASDHYRYSYHPNAVVHKYYCVFRSNWDSIHHPVNYPELARWSDPILFSHSSIYVPGIERRRSSFAIEQLAEVRAVFVNDSLSYLIIYHHFVFSTLLSMVSMLGCEQNWPNLVPTWGVGRKPKDSSLTNAMGTRIMSIFHPSQSTSIIPTSQLWLE